MATLIFFAVATLYFLPAFLPGRHIYGTDYLIGGYFFHEFISAQFEAGRLPRWVPHVYGGLPLFANPGSTFYPFRFFADWLFPVSRIWPTLFVLQFGLAGTGTYLLARELGARRWVALVGGLAFELTGLTMSWVFAGHEGRIIVATFAPLAFFFVHRGGRTAAFWPFVGLAATLGFCLLSFQIQTAYYLLLGTLIWAVFCLWSFGLFQRPRELTKVILLGLVAVGFAFAMAGVNFLPFLDYVEQSPRGGSGGRGYEYSVSWSMPLREITGFAVPEDAGYLDSYRGSNPMKLHTEYVGATVLALFALGFRFARRNRYWWFFVGLGLFMLTIALGGNTPLYRLYYEILPGTKRFRAPSQSLFLVSLAFVMLATLTLERLAQLRGDWEQRSGLASTRPTEAGERRNAGWILGSVVLTGVLLGSIAARGEGAAGAAAFRFALFAAAVAGLLWLWLRERLATGVAATLLALVTAADLWVMGRPFFQTVPGVEEMFAADDVAQFLSTRPGRDRVWVLPLPPGSVYRDQPGNYLMRFGIDQVGGEHGNQLQRWNQYLGAGEQTYIDWHNLIGQATVVNTPGGQAVALASVPGMMEAANIRYLVSMVPLANPDLREVHRGSALVYEQVDALPRAYLVPQAVAVQGERTALARMQSGWDPRVTAFVHSSTPVRLPDGPLQGSAEVIQYEPDRVVVRTRADRPALLVLADNFYADWDVQIDGRAGTLLRTNHALRGAAVPAGEHLVTFAFSARAIDTGWKIYLACMALLVAYTVYILARRFRTGGAAAVEATSPAA